MTSEDTSFCVTEELHSCCCCLRRAPDRDLKTPYTHLGTTEIYSDMLKECFKINVMPDTEGECGICEVCVGRLRDASNFKLQVQRSQAELQARLRGELQARVEDFLKFDDGENKWMLEVSVLSEPAGNSEVSDDDCISQRSYRKCSEDRDAGHRDHTYAKTEWPPAAVPIDGEDGTEGAPCSVRLERLRGDEAPHASQTCLATSRRGPRLASRMEDTPDDTAGLRAEEQAYTCDTCGEHFTDKSRLIEHIQAHVGPTRAVCNKTNVNKYVLKQQKMVHTGKGSSRSGPRLASRVEDTPDDTAGLRAEEQAYTCDTRGEHFTDKSRLIGYIQGHVGPTRAVCNKTNVNKCVLKQQKMVHTGKGASCRGPRLASRATDTPDDAAGQPLKSNQNERTETRTIDKTYAGNIFKKQSTEEGDWTVQIRKHNEESPYKFNACTLLAVKSSVRKDKPIHTPKLYSCKICKKQFTYIYYLNRHIRTHTGQKPFMCDVCGKTFADSSTLRRHRQIHAGLQLYTCDICSKKMRYKGALVRHIRIHAGHKPYTCDVCSKTFAIHSYLLKHQRTHSKPYVCDKCGMQFSRKRCLAMHFIRH